MSLNILFASRNDIIKRTPLNGAVDPDKIIPFMKTAQYKYLLNILGTVLFEYLQAIIADNTINTDANLILYKTLVDNFIVDCLVHYTMVESLPFLAYTFGNGSIYKNTAENATSPSKNDIDFLMQKELQTAQFYAERLVTYLIAYSTDYPQYLETTGKSNNVYSDKSQTYTNGWVL
jgi:hypothetical protein